MKVKLDLIGHQEAAGACVQPREHLYGELLAPVAWHKPIVIRQDGGEIVSTGKVLSHAAGWCRTADGTYAVQLQLSPASSVRRDGASSPLDCDLTWSNADEIITAIASVRAGGVCHEGPVKYAFGHRECFSPGILTALLPFEHDLRVRSGCCPTTATIAIRAILSNAALDWYHSLEGTNFSESLLVLQHEIKLAHKGSLERFNFLSVLYREQLIYVLPSEIPVYDYEQGDNQRALRALIEGWDD